MSVEGWTHQQLMMAESSSRDLDTLLLTRHNKSRLETDLARWTLLGRNYEEALTILNGQGAGGVLSVPRVAR